MGKRRERIGLAMSKERRKESKVILVSRGDILNIFVNIKIVFEWSS